MPRQNKLQANWTSGEVSPLLRGRVDSNRYENGAGSIENFLVWPQGPLVKRSGTKFIANTSAEAIVYPFQFSDITPYLLEFTDLKMRVFSGDLPVMESAVTVLVTGASSVTGTAGVAARIRLTVVAHGLGLSRMILVSGVLGTTEANGYWFIEEIPDVDHIILANSKFVHGWTAGGSVFKPIEIVTPYSNFVQRSLTFAQSGDILYIFHPSFATRKVFRTSETNWTIQEVKWSDGPYLDLNDFTPNLNATNPELGTRLPDVYLELSAYTHTATVVSQTDFNAAADDSGSIYLEYRERDQWRLALITAASIAPGTPRTGTVTIVDNVLLYLDEATKLARQVIKTQSSGYLKQRVTSGNNGFTDTSYRSGGTNDTASYSNAGQRNRIDPQNEIKSANAVGGGVVAGGTVTAQFANTFGAADIGKFLRIHDSGGTAVGYWSQITKVLGTGSTATVGASVALASNQATGKYVLTNEARSVVLKSKKAAVAFNLFRTEDVGRLIRLGFSGRWTWGKITAFTSASQVTVSLFEDMPRDPADASKLAGNQGTTAVDEAMTYDWRLGAWADVGNSTLLGPGFPSVGCFHEQRLYAARTDSQVQTLWGSVIGDFEDMTPTQLDSTVLDDDAINYTLGSSKVNPIKWLESGPSLFVGTSGGEWMARSGGTTSPEPLSPHNVSIVQHTSNGSMDGARPSKVSNSILFPGRSGRKFHEIAYSFADDAILSKDLTIVSEHILRQGTRVTQTGWQQEPHGILWCVLSNGSVAAMTYEKNQEVVAWHRHNFNGTAKSVAVVNASAGDSVFLVIDNAIVRINSDQFFTSSADLPNMLYLDNSITLTGPVTTFQYLPFNGQTVMVVADGVVSGPYTPSAFGVVTLAASANKVQVGLAFTASYTSLPPEGGSEFGSAQGRMKKVSEMALRVYQTPQIQYGQALQTADLTLIRPTGNPFFTGTVPLRPTDSFDLEATVKFASSMPYPCTVLLCNTVLETKQ